MTDAETLAFIQAYEPVAAANLRSPSIDRIDQYLTGAALEEFSADIEYLRTNSQYDVGEWHITGAGFTTDGYGAREGLILDLPGLIGYELRITTRVLRTPRGGAPVASPTEGSREQP